MGRGGGKKCGPGLWGDDRAASGGAGVGPVDGDGDVGWVGSEALLRCWWFDGWPGVEVKLLSRWWVRGFARQATVICGGVRTMMSHGGSSDGQPCGNFFGVVACVPTFVESIDAALCGNK
ncbi:hypothetical protein Tco_0902355 [Tanacetum coccineum]